MTSDLENALQAYVAAQVELHAEIRRAHQAGWSLRRIAAVAGISHEQVRKIVGS